MKFGILMYKYSWISKFFQVHNAHFNKPKSGWMSVMYVQCNEAAKISTNFMLVNEQAVPAKYILIQFEF
jgi:hypothetical protein